MAVSPVDAGKIAGINREAGELVGLSDAERATRVADLTERIGKLGVNDDIKDRLLSVLVIDLETDQSTEPTDDPVSGVPAINIPGTQPLPVDTERPPAASIDLSPSGDTPVAGSEWGDYPNWPGDEDDDGSPRIASSRGSGGAALYAVDDETRALVEGVAENTEAAVAREGFSSEILERFGGNPPTAELAAELLNEYKSIANEVRSGLPFRYDTQNMRTTFEEEDKIARAIQQINLSTVELSSGPYNEFNFDLHNDPADAVSHTVVRNWDKALVARARENEQFDKNTLHISSPDAILANLKLSMEVLVQDDPLRDEIAAKIETFIDYLVEKTHLLSARRRDALVNALTKADASPLLEGVDLSVVSFNPEDMPAPVVDLGPPVDADRVDPPAAPAPVLPAPVAPAPGAMPPPVGVEPVSGSDLGGSRFERSGLVLWGGGLSTAEGLMGQIKSSIDSGTNPEDSTTETEYHAAVVDLMRDIGVLEANVGALDIESWAMFDKEAASRDLDQAYLLLAELLRHKSAVMGEEKGFTVPDPNGEWLVSERELSTQEDLVDYIHEQKIAELDKGSLYGSKFEYWIDKYNQLEDWQKVGLTAAIGVVGAGMAGAGFVGLLVGGGVAGARKYLLSRYSESAPVKTVNDIGRWVGDQIGDGLSAAEKIFTGIKKRFRRIREKEILEGGDVAAANEEYKEILRSRFRSREREETARKAGRILGSVATNAAVGFGAGGLFEMAFGGDEVPSDPLADHDSNRFEEVMPEREDGQNPPASPEPTSTPTPTPTPEPTPSLTPEPEAQGAPAPTSIPEVEPTVTPEPTPNPEPTATPEPTPTATPEPTPTPAPEADAGAEVDGGEAASGTDAGDIGAEGQNEGAGEDTPDAVDADGQEIPQPGTPEYEAYIRDQIEANGGEFGANIAGEELTVPEAADIEAPDAIAEIEFNENYAYQPGQGPTHIIKAIAEQNGMDLSPEQLLAVYESTESDWVTEAGQNPNDYYFDDVTQDVGLQSNTGGTISPSQNLQNAISAQLLKYK